MPSRLLFVALSAAGLAILTLSAVNFIFADDFNGGAEEDDGQEVPDGDGEEPGREPESGAAADNSDGDADEFDEQVEIPGAREGLYVERVGIQSIRTDDGSAGFCIAFTYFGFHDNDREEGQPRQPQRLIRESGYMPNGPSTPL
ncbi:hypothetical protein MMC30_008908 [Trapelia coarctata]|nr:hypothetical protein [Trapelia coarctata]